MLVSWRINIISPRRKERSRPLISVERDDEAARHRFDLARPRRCASRSQRPWEHDLAASLAGTVICGYSDTFLTGLNCSRT